jgi:hypothetical protein
MILEISITAIVSFLAGFYLCARFSRVAYANLYTASIQALKNQSQVHTKAVYLRVRDKVDEINKIMESQLALWGQIDGPNRGASHARWKSVVMNEINDLESNKIDAFRDILHDGVDLKVSVMDTNGNKSTKKMSEIVSDFDTKKPNKAPPEQSKKENDSNKKLGTIKPKLSLIKDTDDDGQST